MTPITPQRMREIEAYQNASTRKPATEQKNDPQLTSDQTTLVAKIRNSAWKDYLQELSQDIIITLHSEHIDNLYPQGETYHISTR